MEWLVYAVTAGGGRSAAVRFGGERLRRVSVGRVAAIVRPVRTAPRATSRNLLRHGRVVDALWQSSAAILPARFGTTVRDRTELEQILRSRQEELVHRLALVRHRAQMTCRVPDAQAAGAMRAARRPASGAEYMRRRAAELRSAAHVPELDAVRRAVRRWVRAERVQRSGSLATVYHLVPRGAAARYRSAAERASSGAGVRLLVSGPWPPYAFAAAWDDGLADGAP